MGWLAARDDLVELLAGVDEIDVVLRVWPPNATEIGLAATAAILTPAGHTTRRLAGADREQVWHQRVTVLRHTADLTTASMQAATDLALAATLAIDDALDGAVTLGGSATSTAPFRWDEATVWEIPAGSAQLFAGYPGVCDVSIIGPGPRGA